MASKKAPPTKVSGLEESPLLQNLLKAAEHGDEQAKQQVCLLLKDLVRLVSQNKVVAEILLERDQIVKQTLNQE